MAKNINWEKEYELDKDKYLDFYKKKKKKKKKKKSEDKLPDEILPIPNQDKTFQEVWFKGRNLLNFPHSWRAVVSARVGAGKSTILKNILLRQDPPFKQIYVIHIDPDSKDYEEVDGVEMITNIPAVTDPIFHTKHKKTLLILDDLEYKFLDKAQLRNLDRIWGYASSHLGISCAVLAQDVYNIPPCIRRMSNIWILGKINNDISSFLSVAERCGLKREDFCYVYDKYIHGDHDMFWIDRTKDSPAEFRINGYTVIDKHNNYNPTQHLQWDKKERERPISENSTQQAHMKHLNKYKKSGKKRDSDDKYNSKRFKNSNKKYKSKMKPYIEK